jgi:probable F420-dependent oxidoreductase
LSTSTTSSLPEPLARQLTDRSVYYQGDAIPLVAEREGARDDDRARSPRLRGMQMTVRVGLMLVPHADPVDVVATARHAEEAGFDFLGCGEHVLFHGPTPNAFVCLAAAAAATTRIRLLSALTVVPLYPSGLLAKLVATLDRLSGGRLDLGVGVGGEYTPEFAACGVPVAERGARTDESLEICTRLFAGEAVTLTGQFASLDNQRLDPLPLQVGGPPLWVGGRRGAAIRRAAKFGSYWLPYLLTPGQLRSGLDDIRASAESIGRRSSDIRGAYYAWTTVNRDAATARSTATSTLGEIYRQDFGPLLDRYVPTGTPEQVLGRLQDYVAAGAESVLLSPACPRSELPHMIDTLAQEVLPRLREGGVAGPTRSEAMGG